MVVKFADYTYQLKKDIELTANTKECPSSDCQYQLSKSLTK